MAQWTYFHQLDPFLIGITSSFGIRWYSMAYICGFITSYCLIKQCIIKNGVYPFFLNAGKLLDMVTWVAFGVLIGARMGYALFYKPELLISFEPGFPYYALLKVYEGGLSSHGGVIGVIIALTGFGIKNKIPVLCCMDMVSFTAGLGLFFGRMANFINGELYGRVITGPSWFAVQFPSEMLNWISEKKIYDLKQLAPAFQALNKGITRDQWLDAIYDWENTGYRASFLYKGLQSLILATQQGHLKVISALEPAISHRYPSQIYQALLEGLFPFFCIWLLWRKKPLKPGVVFCTWAGLYAAMRITGEVFRMPDYHLGFRALGLTRGQWLSLGMLLPVIFIALFIWKNRNQSPSYGGWKSK